MKHKTRSIIKTLNISYLILSLATLIIVSSVLLFAWMVSNNRLLDTLQHEAQTYLLDDVEDVLASPIHIISFGQDLVKTGSVDMSVPESRNPYFVSVLKNAPSHIYSYSLGTTDGYYYGARRSMNDSFEIMLADPSTDFHSVYYSIDDTSNMSTEVLKNPVFDPRTRPWYTEAISQDTLVFSPIYKHFVMDDLALSISAPATNDENELIGVLGAHETVSKLFINM
jgi:hypothetical protein